MAGLSMPCKRPSNPSDRPMPSHNLTLKNRKTCRGHIRYPYTPWVALAPHSQSPFDETKTVDQIVVPLGDLNSIRNLLSY